MKNYYFLLTLLAIISVHQNIWSQEPIINTNHRDAPSNQVIEIVSHGTSQIVEERAVACFNEEFGFTFLNSYWRSYRLSDFGITGDRALIGAQIGYSFEDNAGITQEMDILVKAYLTDALFPTGNLTEIASGVLTIDLDGSFSVVDASFDIPVNISDNQEVVIEARFPDTFELSIDIRVGQNQSGETAPSYFSTPDCDGIEIITFEDIGWPGSAIINMIVDSNLSVDENLNSQISLYPNPTEGIINIKKPTNIEIESVILQDIYGKILGVYKEDQIDFSSYAKGVYALSISTNNGTTVKKIVKR